MTLGVSCYALSHQPEGTKDWRSFVISKPHQPDERIKITKLGPVAGVAVVSNVTDEMIGFFNIDVGPCDVTDAESAEVILGLQYESF